MVAVRAEEGLTVNELVRVFLSRRRAPECGYGRVLRRIARCGTSVLGGRIEACDACGYQQLVWNRCLDRHCPSCMGGTSARWVERQLGLLLPVPYYHVVFTLPRRIGDIAYQNKRALYGLLLRVSAEVVQTIARDAKHLGAEVGFQSVLHTWNQRLEHHPHVHMVIPGGGIGPDGRWKSCRKNFFLPTAVLSKLFRRRFLEELEALRASGALRFSGSLLGLTEAAAWSAVVEEAKKQSWNVYARRPFSGPATVYKYLAGYTHRGPISNHRLLKFDGETVSFGARGRRGLSDEVVHLPLDVFIRRFAMHVVPGGFMRLRSYGFLAHRVRKERVAQLQGELGSPLEPETPRVSEREVCPQCAKGRLERVAHVACGFGEPLLVYELKKATTGPPKIPRVRRVAA